MQTKTFLGLITALTILLLTFPNYAQVFYPSSQNQVKQAVDYNKSKIQTIEYKISGMTCDACTLHVANEVNKVAGIFNLKVSYPSRNALVTFDKTKTNVGQVQKAIQATGYKVTDITIKQ